MGPYLQKDLDELESVQRLACKVCTKELVSFL